MPLSWRCWKSSSEDGTGYLLKDGLRSNYSVRGDVKIMKSSFTVDVLCCKCEDLRLDLKRSQCFTGGVLGRPIQDNVAGWKR